MTAPEHTSPSQDVTADDLPSTAIQPTLRPETMELLEWLVEEALDHWEAEHR